MRFAKVLPVFALMILLLGCHEEPQNNHDQQQSSEQEITACEKSQDCPKGLTCQNHQCLPLIVCGDGIKTSPEECDDGNTDSFDGCDSSCHEEEPSHITLMNWNILFGNYAFPGTAYVDGKTLEYTRDFAPAGGAAPTPPRALAMGEALATLDSLPAIINVMEMDPSWKEEDNFSHLKKLGYKMLYPNTPFMLTQLIYRPGQVTLIKKGFINLTSRWGGAGPAMKTCVTYGVFQEKTTNELFIALSTHWDPNDGVSLKDGLGGALDALYLNEMDRIEEAKESIDLINRLRQEYPTAHFFYGGDFNTIDFDLVNGIIAEVFAPLDTSEMTLPSLFPSLGAKAKPEADFTGSFGYFANNSGLLGGRQQAKNLGLKFEDISSTKDADIVTNLLNKELNTPIIIDYNFYSPEMRLTGYQVMKEGNFDLVSDHQAVKLELDYFPRGQNPLPAAVYPDDSGTDWYTPIPEYQGRVFTVNDI